MTGRPITSGTGIDPLLTHWICKDCETLNATNRNHCLNCDKPRRQVQITDYEKVKALRKEWGYVASGTGKNVVKINKKRAEYNNGEYP